MLEWVYEYYRRRPSVIEPKLRGVMPHFIHSMEYYYGQFDSILIDNKGYIVGKIPSRSKYCEYILSNITVLFPSIKTGGYNPCSNVKESKIWKRTFCSYPCKMIRENKESQTRVLKWYSPETDHPP